MTYKFNQYLYAQLPVESNQKMMSSRKRIEFILFDDQQIDGVTLPFLHLSALSILDFGSLEQSRNQNQTLPLKAAMSGCCLTISNSIREHVANRYKCISNRQSSRLDDQLHHFLRQAKCQHTSLQLLISFLMSCYEYLNCFHISDVDLSQFIVWMFNRIQNYQPCTKLPRSALITDCDGQKHERKMLKANVSTRPIRKIQTILHNAFFLPFSRISSADINEQTFLCL